MILARNLKPVESVESEAPSFTCSTWTAGGSGSAFKIEDVPSPNVERSYGGGSFSNTGTVFRFAAGVSFQLDVLVA